MYIYDENEPTDTYEHYIQWRRKSGTPYYNRLYEGTWEDWMAWDARHHPAWKPGELEAHRAAKKAKHEKMIAKEAGRIEVLKKLEEQNNV